MRVGIKIRCLDQLGEPPTFGGRRRSRTPSNFSEPGFQGQSADHPTCIIFLLSINISMISVDEAIQPLLNVAQGTYTPGASHSCIREFIETFPKQEPPAFIPDGLPRQLVRTATAK